MFRIVETFNNAVVAASAVQYHAGSEILHALMVAAVDANLLTAHDVSGECPGDQIHPMVICSPLFVRAASLCCCLLMHLKKFFVMHSSAWTGF